MFIFVCEIVSPASMLTVGYPILEDSLLFLYNAEGQYLLSSFSYPAGTEKMQIRLGGVYRVSDMFFLSGHHLFLSGHHYFLSGQKSRLSGQNEHLSGQNNHLSDQNEHLSGQKYIYRVKLPKA